MVENGEVRLRRRRPVVKRVMDAWLLGPDRPAQARVSPPVPVTEG